MKFKKTTSINKILNYIKHNDGAMYKDLAKKFPDISRSTINNNLTKLSEYGYIDKVKLVGKGNLCKYTFIKGIDESKDKPKDWGFIVNIFNKLVRMR